MRLLSLTLVGGLLLANVGCGSDSNRSYAGGGSAGASTGGSGGSTGGSGGSTGGSAGTSSGGSAGSGTGGGAGSGTGGGAGSGTGGSAGSGTGGSAGSGTGGSAGTGGSSGGCPSTHACAPSVPSGWIGPVAVGADNTLLPCPGEYPTTEKDSQADLNIQDAVCGCACGTPSGTCAAARYVGYASDNCNNAQGASALSVGQCFVTSSSTRYSFDQPDMTSKSCPAVPTKVVPTASFADQVRVCGGASDIGGCNAGEICVPIPSSASGFTAKCVYKAGDQACPTGYPNKQVLYDDFTDTRSCTSCTCTASGGSCRASFTAYQTTNCTGSSQSFSRNQDGSGYGTCAATNWTAVKYNSTTTAVQPTCTASTSTASGELTPTGPTTVCCAP